VCVRVEALARMLQAACGDTEASLREFKVDL